jgi:tetratricopeptide (TPR) repeat protein
VRQIVGQVYCFKRPFLVLFQLFQRFPPASVQRRSVAVFETQLHLPIVCPHPILRVNGLLRPACYNPCVAEAAPQRAYSRNEVCRLLGVSESVLEGWEANGFVNARERYDFPDLIALQTLRQLRRSRVRPERIRRMIDSLKTKLQGVSDPLTELKVFSDGRKLAVRVGSQKMEPLSGQLLLDFDRQEIARLLQFPSKAADEELARVLAVRQMESERWFEKALELEQTGAPPDQIIPAYQRAVELDPDSAAAHVNLGTLYYHLRRWDLAEQHYLRAVEVRPEYALAHFNLGNLYDELNDWVRALERYLLALRIQPDYSDAHYNLALLYQSHGETIKAVRHWRAYLKLDPAGYWAGIARRELAKLRQETVIPGAAESH